MSITIEPGIGEPERILRLPKVEARTGLSRSSIYVRVAKGTFPPPIRLGPRAVGWLESEVNQWIREQISATRGEEE